MQNLVILLESWCAQQQAFNLIVARDLADSDAHRTAGSHGRTIEELAGSFLLHYTVQPVYRVLVPGRSIKNNTCILFLFSK